MPKPNLQKETPAPLTEAKLQELLAEQTALILTAVDKRLEQMEERFSRKLDRLTNTLDKFLKRMTDMEEEFTFMKNDVNRIKAVFRERLGVSLD